MSNTRLYMSCSVISSSVGLGWGLTKILNRRLRVAIVASWRLIWIPRFFCRALCFRLRRWCCRWGLQWWGCALLPSFLLLLCGIRWSKEVVRNSCPRVISVHYNVEDDSQCLRYVDRCIEDASVPQNFKLFHAFHIPNHYMIINRSRCKSVVVQSTPEISL